MVCSSVQAELVRLVSGDPGRLLRALWTPCEELLWSAVRRYVHFPHRIIADIPGNCGQTQPDSVGDRIRRRFKIGYCLSALFIRQVTLPLTIALFLLAKR